MPLTLGDANIIRTLFYRIQKANNILIILGNEGPEYGKAKGVAKGLAGLTKVEILVDKDIPLLSMCKRRQLVENIDLVITLNRGDGDHIGKYLILDIKNSGGYIIVIASSLYEFCRVYDYVVVIQLPGLMKQLIRSCNGRDSNAKNTGKVST